MRTDISVIKHCDIRVVIVRVAMTSQEPSILLISLRENNLLWSLLVYVQNTCPDTLNAS